MSLDSEFSQTIFLSYSWKDFDVANKIDKDFRIAGINIIRDIRMDYKDNIPNFMERISKEDYAILLISRSYLESSNCMREILELFNDKEYEKKILPIILPNACIFSSNDVVDIIKFWENKINELNSKTKELSSLANISGIIEDIDHFTKIRNSIDTFITKIKALNCKSFKELDEQNYKPILDFIGILPMDISSMILKLIKISNLEERDIEIDKLLEKYPNNGNLIFLKANVAFSEKKLQKAKKLFLNLIEKNPKVSELYNNLGVCYREQYLFNEALEAFNKAMAINPNDGVAYCNLGLLYKENFNNKEEAQKNYEISLKINPSSGETHYNFALLLHENEDFIKSKYHYEEALKIYPSLSSPERIADVHYSYANLLFLNLKDFINAKIQYEYCLSIDSNNFKAQCNYAVLLKNVFYDYVKSCFHYEKALEVEPKDVITHYNLGNLYYKHLNNIELARFHYLKAIEIDETYSNAYVGLGNLLKDISPNESKLLYEKALSIDPSSILAQKSYAIIIKILKKNGKSTE